MNISKSKKSTANGRMADACVLILFKIYYFPVCLSPETPCDPLIEDALGLYSVTSKEERNLAKIEEINSRPGQTWRAAPTSLLGLSFSEVPTARPFILKIPSILEAIVKG